MAKLVTTDTVNKSVAFGEWRKNIEYSAPNGFSDTNEITLTRNVGGFSPPDAQFYIGFGIGWLYENPVDTSMQGVVITQASGDIGYQYDHQNNRTIKSKDGIKVLESLMHPLAGGGFDSAGNLTADTNNAAWPAGTTFTMCSLTRGSIGTGGAGPDTQFQWKQDRMMNFPMGGANPNSRNSAYLAAWDYGDNLQSKVVVSNGGTTGLGRQATFDNVWTATQWTWKHNTPDGVDGSMRLISMKDGETGVTDDFVDVGNISDIILSIYPELPKVFLIEDYIGSRNGTTTPYDMLVDRTDLYWKVNGDAFYLCDNSDPALLTELPIPLIPTAFPASNKVTLNLWKGRMSSYAGKFIHIRDKYDILTAVVEL